MSAPRAFLRILVALCVALSAALAIGPSSSGRVAAEPVNLAPDAEPSAEYTAGWNSLAALNDGEGVTSGGSHGAVWGSYSGTRPSSRWVQYDWPEPVTISATEVLFWHDAQPGTGDNVAVPQSWSMSYWDGGTESWEPMPSPSAYGTDPDAANRTTFDEVTTGRVRIVLQAAPNDAGTAYAAVAVSEWAVIGVRPEDPPPDDDDPLAVDEVHIPTSVGVQPELPSSIGVTRLDGQRDDVDVTWDPVDPGSLAAPGSFDVAGVADTVTATVQATVWVRAEGSDGGEIVAVEYSSALTVAGVAPDLPTHVVVVHEDGSLDSRIPVIWRELDPSEYAEEGIVEVTGTVAGTELVASLLLVVDAPAPTDDEIPPVLSVTVDPDRPSTGWWTSPVTVSFTASDAVDPTPTVEAMLDDAAWSEVAGSLTVDTDGPHTLLVRASDDAGNVSAEQELQLGLDTVAPEVEADVADTPEQSTITLTATDATSGVVAVQYAVGEEFEATYMGPVVVNRTEVKQTVRFRATDEAGNTSELETVTIPALDGEPVDTEAPIVTLASAPSRPDGLRGWWRSPVTVTATATDDVDPSPRVEASVDGGAWTPAPGPVVVARAGAHTVRARAVDAAGNQSDVVSREIRLDPRAPKVRAQVNRRNRVVRLRATDPVSGVFRIHYRTGSGKWRVYRKPIRVGDRAVRIRYRAVDVAGNVSATRKVVLPSRR